TEPPGARQLRRVRHFERCGAVSGAGDAGRRPIDSMDRRTKTAAGSRQQRPVPSGRGERLVYASIAALLKEKMGLDAESIGVACVERAVRQRLAATGLEDVQVYWAGLSASEQELQELIEAIVIPETWFFRDPQAFTALVQVVREEWLPTHPAR